MPRRSIFVIDDDLGMLRTIDRLLRLYGFDVQTFGSAEDFLKGSNPRDVGLLVLDINLSGMSGIELRQKLALSGISIPVIFITGNDSDAIRNAALEVGCTAYLQTISGEAIDGRNRKSIQRATGLNSTAEK